MMKWIEATRAGGQPNIDRVGVSYTLQGEAGADQNDLSVKTPPQKEGLVLRRTSRDACIVG